MDLLVLIRTYVRLQAALIATLKATLGQRDWSLLLDVPKRGAVLLGNDEWSYVRHGTGVRFHRDRDGVVVDANRHLDLDSGLFELGRLVEYAESLGVAVSTADGKPAELSFETGGVLLAELVRQHKVEAVSELPGEVYLLK